MIFSPFLRPLAHLELSLYRGLPEIDALGGFAPEAEVGEEVVDRVVLAAPGVSQVVDAVVSEPLHGAHLDEERAVGEALDTRRQGGLGVLGEFFNSFVLLFRRLRHRFGCRCYLCR